MKNREGKKESREHYSCDEKERERKHNALGRGRERESDWTTMKCKQVKRIFCLV